jgi:hypothetical protein
MSSSKLGSTLSGRASRVSEPNTSLTALEHATMLSGRFASELGNLASEDLRRKWVEFRMQELQEKEAKAARGADESAKTEKRRSSRRKEKRREESAPPAPTPPQSGILGPAPWTTLPVDSLATEAFRRREASAPAKPSAVKWGRFDYAGEAAMYPSGDVHVSIKPKTNVDGLFGPVEKGLPKPGYVTSQPFGGPAPGEVKIGQGLVRQASSSAFKQPLSQALNNAGVYQASTWATSSQDFGAFRPVLKWARSQGEWNADRRRAESAMQPDLPDYPH